MAQLHFTRFLFSMIAGIHMTSFHVKVGSELAMDASGGLVDEHWDKIYTGSGDPQQGSSKITKNLTDIGRVRYIQVGRDVGRVAVYELQVFGTGRIFDNLKHSVTCAIPLAE